MQKSTILANFCNAEIPGLRCCQSRDSGLAKTAGIPGFQIPGLQSLATMRHTLQGIQTHHYCIYANLN